MANRVTATEVRVISDIDTSLVDATIDVFITVANLLINEVIDTTALDATHLKEIERWLAAHFVAIRDVKSASEAVSGEGASVNVSYLSSVGMNLLQTTYGQQALILDTTGGLAALQRDSMNGGRISASLKAMGPYSES